MYHYPGLDDDDETRFYSALERMHKRNMSEPTTALTVVPNGPANTRSDAVHMKLKLRGSPEKLLFFHWLMTELDQDWPYTQNRRNSHLPVYCQDCKGYIYRDPEYSPEEIKVLAKQIHLHPRLKGDLHCKVKMFTRLSNCQDVATTVEAQEAIETQLESGKDPD